MGVRASETGGWSYCAHVSFRDVIPVPADFTMGNTGVDSDRTDTEGDIHNCVRLPATLLRGEFSPCHIQ